MYIFAQIITKIHLTMKKLILFIFCIFTICLHALAYDTIVLRNGDFINAIVNEISSNQIKYKKASNPNGPLYTLEKHEVLSIKYENGDVDKFDSSTQPTKIDQSQNLHVKAVTAPDNEQKKGLYSSLPKLNLKASDKKSKDFFPIMAFTDSSVISTNELTISVSPEGAEYYDGGWKVKIGYTFMILNKTDNPIYIDKAICFKRDSDLNSKSYYDNAQTTVTHGNSTSGGIGVGFGSIGIGLGSGSSSSHSETYSVDRYLVIGPHSKANLAEYKYIRLSEKKAKFKTVSDIEYWGFDFLCESDLKQGEVKTYTEQNSPYSNSYQITYSTDKDFKNCYTFNFELYAKYIVGAKIKESKWSMGRGATNIVAEYQKIVPEFWTKSLSIIGTPGEFRK